MSSHGVFSSPEQLRSLAELLSKYARLPFSPVSIPGAVMEGVLAHIRGGQVLRTYDFVDVVKLSDKCGWQVKSTMAGTPVTWKRAKIPDSVALIAASRAESQEPSATQKLGDAIIRFCNEHAAESLRRYNLNEIGYSRLIIQLGGDAFYFERLLCTRERPYVFDPEEFEWRWSTPKKTIKKEQLPALHGISRKTGDKWFAWHGLGENQLHFAGERHWWPREGDPHAVAFRLPGEPDKISLEDFVKLIARSDVPS